MLLMELEKQDIETGYYDPSEDKYGTRKLTDVRKNRIFLKSLNKLKKIRAVQELERIKRQNLLSVMYATPDTEGGGGPIGGF